MHVDKHKHKPVEIHLVNLRVKGLNAFLLLGEENGEISPRSFHRKHLGKVVDFYTNFIQQAFYSCIHKENQELVDVFCTVTAGVTDIRKGSRGRKLRTYEEELRFHHSQVCR